MIDPKKFFIKTLIMFILIIICGVLLFVTHKTQVEYIGLISGGLLVTSINLVHSIAVLTNKDYKKLVEIEAKDERTLTINSKASEITSFITMIISCFGAIAGILFNKLEYLWIFGGMILFYSVTFLITKAILNKKY